MTQRNDGGPAFPTSFSPDYPNELRGGLSMRDYFAAKAMQGDWAAQNAHTGEIQNKVSAQDLESRASVYYRAADAMLAARERT